MISIFLQHTSLNSVLFSNTDTSQGSAATNVRYGGIFHIYFFANFLETVPMKEFEKLIAIW